MSCRDCDYYRMEPHKIIWEFGNSIDEYDGVCTHPDSKYSIHTNAGSCCFLFRKKISRWPDLDAYNQHKKVGVNVEKEQS